MNRTLIIAISWMLVGFLAVFSAETYGKLVRVDNERYIYRDRAEHYEQQLEEQQEAINRAEEDVQRAIILLEEMQNAMDLVQLKPLGEYMCTAYCTEKRAHICGTGTGITASGQPVQAGVTVAADTGLFNYGDILYIEGVGLRIVQDKGSAVNGKHLDVAVDTHYNAEHWSGYGTHAVYKVVLQ